MISNSTQKLQFGMVFKEIKNIFKTFNVWNCPQGAKVTEN